MERSVWPIAASVAHRRMPAIPFVGPALAGLLAELGRGAFSIRAGDADAVSGSASAILDAAC